MSLVSFDGTKRAFAFDRSPMVARNRTGGPEFPSIGIAGGTTVTTALSARMQHAFAPLFGPTHWHSRHVPGGFEADRSWVKNPAALGSINLPISLTGWQRVTVRVKGVSQVWPERELYDWIRMDAIWDEPFGPLFFIGGAGIYGDPTPPQLRVVNSFGEAEPRLFEGPLHGVTNIVANYGDAEGVEVIDRFIEFSINTAQGRQIVFGGYAGNAEILNLGSEGMQYWNGGTMPDGLFVGNGTQAELGSPFSGSLQTGGGFYLNNPGLNPPSLVPPHAPMFSGDFSRTQQLIMQFWGSHGTPGPTDHTVYDA